MLESIEFPGPAQSALHFIGNPDHTMLVTKATQLLPELCVRLNDTAAALHRLQHDHPDFRVRTKRVFNGSNVTEGNPYSVVDKLEFAAIKPAIRDGQNALGLPVK